VFSYPLPVPPDQSKPKPGPPKSKPVAAKAAVPVYRNCDRCGHSKIDNQPIAKATHQFETERGSLYLCGHHFRVHCEAILSKGYPVREVA
jgi:hypothetical protein